MTEEHGFLDKMAEVVGVVGDFARITWNPMSWIPLGKTVLRVVKGVENICKDRDNGFPDLPGDVKEDMAIQFINERINLPLLNENMEAELFRFLIRLIVLIINETIGKEWTEFLARE